MAMTHATMRGSILATMSLLPCVHRDLARPAGSGIRDVRYPRSGGTPA
jgi:hypothetical protein